jgi:putative hydrolases of HD superfamily
LSDARTILDFLAFSERLKRELRHCWLADGRQESVADHSWQMALMAILLHRELDEPVDIGRTLKMILTHDLVEAETGDVPFFEEGPRRAQKAAHEGAAIVKIRDWLGEPVGQELFDLWQEYEEKDTPEARFASALDHLEVQIQHNLAPLSTWSPIEYDLVYTKMDRACAYDPALAVLCRAVKDDAEHKMRKGGIDVDAVKRRLGVT